MEITEIFIYLDRFLFYFQLALKRSYDLNIPLVNFYFSFYVKLIKFNCRSVKYPAATRLKNELGAQLLP